MADLVLRPRKEMQMPLLQELVWPEPALAALHIITSSHTNTIG